MNASQLKLTYIGGQRRCLSSVACGFSPDPTFDAPGGEYTTGPVTLRKIMGPALGSDAIGLLDAVLLTHDHHFDNLDHAGRALLGNMERVFTLCVDIEQDPGNPIVRKVRSDFKNSLAQRSTRWHSNRPAELYGLDVLSDSLSVIWKWQCLEPLSNRFATTLRSIEDRWDALAGGCCILCTRGHRPSLVPSASSLTPQCTIYGTFLTMRSHLWMHRSRRVKHGRNAPQTPAGSPVVKMQY